MAHSQHLQRAAPTEESSLLDLDSCQAPVRALASPLLSLLRCLPPCPTSAPARLPRSLLSTWAQGSSPRGCSPRGFARTRRRGRGLRRSTASQGRAATSVAAAQLWRPLPPVRAPIRLVSAPSFSAPRSRWILAALRPPWTRRVAAMKGWHRGRVQVEMQ